MSGSLGIPVNLFHPPSTPSHPSQIIDPPSPLPSPTFFALRGPTITELSPQITAIVHSYSNNHVSTNQPLLLPNKLPTSTASISNHRPYPPLAPPPSPAPTYLTDTQTPPIPQLMVELPPNPSPDNNPPFLNYSGDEVQPLQGLQMHLIQVMIPYLSVAELFFDGATNVSSTITYYTCFKLAMGTLICNARVRNEDDNESLIQSLGSGVQNPLNDWPIVASIPPWSPLDNTRFKCVEPPSSQPKDMLSSILPNDKLRLHVVTLKASVTVHFVELGVFS
ncbi:hypothetical protein Sjap_005161 [Stephania japonica]|uniref:Uncharacterized protein n=1 Tax=Stephania japonica TaxID=461633 RepID=A0AAP0K3J3_9MAGN